MRSVFEIFISRFALLCYRAFLMFDVSGENGKAIVQLLADLSIDSYSLDDIAYYVGSREDTAM